MGGEGSTCDSAVMDGEGPGRPRGEWIDEPAEAEAEVDGEMEEELVPFGAESESIVSLSSASPSSIDTSPDAADTIELLRLCSFPFGESVGKGIFLASAGVATEVGG